MQFVWLLSLVGDGNDDDDNDGRDYLLTFPLPFLRSDETVTILYRGQSVQSLRRRNHHTPNNSRPLTSNLGRTSAIELGKNNIGSFLLSSSFYTNDWRLATRNTWVICCAAQEVKTEYACSL